MLYREPSSALAPFFFSSVRHVLLGWAVPFACMRWQHWRCLPYNHYSCGMLSDEGGGGEERGGGMSSRRCDNHTAAIELSCTPTTATTVTSRQ